MSGDGAYSARFNDDWSDKSLRARIAVKADPLKGLSDLGPAEAALRLQATFMALVIPTGQMVAALRELIERAKAYCDRAYPKSVAVMALMYGSPSAYTPESCNVTCLTGLAGVGKSALFDAFCRVFATSEFIEIPGHARLELHACWRMTIRGHAGFSKLVNPHFRDKSKLLASRIVSCTVSEAAAQGIALILPDEFQFITSGSANAMMANLLFRLAQVGPPVIYACNYSMVHALWRRPQQDRDRLLLNPIILHPEQPGADWTATAKGCLDVADELSLLKTESNIQLLHDYTFGIKRSLRSLLVLAYLQMRKEKQARVTASHLSIAYRSPEYGAMREDVENLVQGAVTPSLLRKDLACPFVGASVLPAAKKVVEHPTARISAEDATQGAQLSMLGPEVRRLVEVMGNQALPPGPTKARASRRPLATADNLVGGASRFSSKEKKVT